MCHVYFMWTGFFMILTKNCHFRRESSSRNRRVHIRRIWYHCNRRTSYKLHLRVSVQCAVFALCECEFHDFDQKLLFSSGEVSSEQASPYQTSVVSLESQIIIYATFKSLNWMCRVYFVWTWIPWFWPEIAVFVGRGLLGTRQSITDGCGVIGIETHSGSTIKGISWLRRVYFVWMWISWFCPEIAVFAGRGLLGTGESISGEYGVIGMAEHRRITI